MHYVSHACNAFHGLESANQAPSLRPFACARSALIRCKASARKLSRACSRCCASASCLWRRRACACGREVTRAAGGLPTRCIARCFGSCSRTLQTLVPLRMRVASAHGLCMGLTKCCMPGQGSVAAAHGAMSVVAQLLFREASPRMITSEEERLRALQDICSALPRTEQALGEQVRQLSHAHAKRRAAGNNW